MASDGLNLIHKALELQSISRFHEINLELIVDTEVEAYQFISTYLTTHGVLPATMTVGNYVREATFEYEQGVPEPWEHYLQRVIDRGIYTRIATNYGNVRQALNSQDTHTALALIREFIEQVRSIELSDRDIDNVKQVVEFGYEKFIEAKDRGSHIGGIPTGWEWLDNETSGWQPGDFNLVAGRPGAGKTYVWLKMVLKAWSSGYKVLAVSMELPKAQIGQRIIGLMSKVNPNFLREGHLSFRGERIIESVMDDIEREHRMKIFFGGFKATLSDVEVLMAEVEPDIVFIDGLYLLRPPKGVKYYSEHAKMADLADRMKLAALDRNIPIICTTQFNRDFEKLRQQGRGGGLHTIRGADEFGMHSSVVLGLEGGPMYDGMQQRKISIMKGREGESGYMFINYHFQPVNLDFSAYTPIAWAEDRAQRNSGEAAPRRPQVRPTTNLDHMI